MTQNNNAETVTKEWLASIGVVPPEVAFYDGGFSMYFNHQHKWLKFGPETTRADVIDVRRILGERSE